MVEVRSYNNPPELVGKVMGAVCILLGESPEWSEAKRLLQKPKFLEILETYDKDNIKSRVINQLKPYVLSKSFTPEKLTTVSVAATSLCMWVIAIYGYHVVLQEIKPKRARLLQAEKRLASSTEALETVRNKLLSLETKIKRLNEKFIASEKKKVALGTFSVSKIQLTSSYLSFHKIHVNCRK